MAPCYANFRTPRKSFVKFHPIKKNIHYRLWNPVKNGWIMKDPIDMSLVYCSCGFNSQDYNKSTYLKIFILKLNRLTVDCPCKEQRLTVILTPKRKRSVLRLLGYISTVPFLRMMLFTKAHAQISVHAHMYCTYPVGS